MEDEKRKLGLNFKVQALAFLLCMAEDPAFKFPSFCDELTALEVRICENAGHFRGAEGEKFVYDDTKFWARRSSVTTPSSAVASEARLARTRTIPRTASPS